MDQSVMYTQLQPWSTVGASPVMEQVSAPPIPARIGELYRTPRPHPWRPTLGYETVQVQRLPSQCITNQFMDSCYTPSGMATEPLKFPNLVTGFERNPSHAARAALYTRYTLFEWKQDQVRLQNEVNAGRHYSDELTHATERLVNEGANKVQEGQNDSSRMISERISEINFWERELTSELDRIIHENEKMQECMRILQQTIRDVEAPLFITQECLYHREARKGIELVHDEPEKALLREVEVVRNCRKKLDFFTDKCTNQLSNGRAIQNEIELDISNKNTALGIDTMCQQLNNSSRGIQFYGGIEHYDNNITEKKSWTEASNDLVKKSQMIRAASRQLQIDIETMINQVGREIWKAWCQTNNALADRIAEILPAKNKLLSNLQQIQQEIFTLENNLELLKKAVADKSASLKVAQTRLEARGHRPQAELCRDPAQCKMIDEVKVIKGMIDDFHAKLQECEAQHQQLLRTRVLLEDNLKSKMDALFIDRDKCMSLRRSYPINNTVAY